MEERIRGANTADALVGRLARGDLGALSALYDRYARDIYAVAAHALGRGPAEEVVQDVFVRVWQRASQFEAARGSGAAWIMAIARHRIVDELRRRGRRREVLDTIDDLLERPVDHGLVVHEETPEDGRRREVLDAVRQLPEEQRHVILLAYFGGLTQAEIARELECPLGTVKKRTRLALQKLRASLAERPLVQVLERGVSEEQR